MYNRNGCGTEMGSCEIGTRTKERAMRIKKPAEAGNCEKNDIFVRVSPISGGITIDLASPVMKLYGDRIREVIVNTIRNMGIDGVEVIATDGGAIDCVIEARMETALLRALD